MSGPLQSMADPMSTYNTSLRFLQEEQKKRWQRESDRINEKYFDYRSNKKSAPDTPASRALDKRLVEIDRQYYPPVNASKETGFTNRFSSWFGKK
jgi:hypothetical protein